jgi:hypothetical protein
MKVIKAVLWIRIRIHKEPHSFGCLGSGSVLGMGIRIQEHGRKIDQKLQINLVFCLSKRLLYRLKYVFLLITYFKYFFIQKLKFNFL